MKADLKYSINNENPGERKRFIRGLFDSIVPTYDLLNRSLSMGIDTLWRRSLVKEAGNLNGLNVLDLCCGTGDLTRAFLKNGARVMSLDFSLPMIKKGIKKNNIKYCIAADACSLPFRDSTFDIASIAFGIRNIPDIKNLISETRRVLKPGGRFFILELTRPPGRAMSLLYNFYLKTLIPKIGGFVSGKHTAYKYLSETISTFIDPGRLRSILEEFDYGDIMIYSKTCGIACIIVGTNKKLPG